MSSQKFEILHFDGLLLSKWYKVSAKKVQKGYLSWHWRVTLKSDAKSPIHSKVLKFHFCGIFLFEIYKVWAKKIQGSYLSWHWSYLSKPEQTQALWFQNRLDELGELSLEHSKFCTLMDSFCLKYIMFQLENFRGIMCHNTEGWCKISKKIHLWLEKWLKEFS